MLTRLQERRSVPYCGYFEWMILVRRIWTLENTTDFYIAIYNPLSHNICPAIKSDWLKCNSIILNAKKTVLTNISFRGELLAIEDLCILPSTSVKLLGIISDSHLTFNEHVDFLVSKSNIKLILMRKLKMFGLTAEGLRTFHCTSIQTVLTHTSPVQYMFLSEQSKI